MGHITPIEILRRLGVGCLTQQQLDSITGVQVTVYTTRPPTIDFAYIGDITVPSLKEVDGKWVEA